MLQRLGLPKLNPLSVRPPIAPHANPALIKQTGMMQALRKAVLLYACICI